MIATRYPTLQLEVWPAVDVNETIVFGSAPLLEVDAPTLPSTTFEWTVPHLRDRLTTATFVIGRGTDGRRVVLASDISLDPTPPWTGTLAAWWFGTAAD